VSFLTLESLLLFLVIFLGAFLGTAAIRSLARRRGWMILPRHDRWHQLPTALHGGTGFFPAFLAGAIWVVLRKWQTDQIGLGSFEATPPELRLAVALLLGAVMMFLFGWWDDIKQFRPATKLICQVAAASLFIFAGGIFPLTGIYVVDLLVTYFWFVGITNAVNMLDNMDGLSSGVVILGGLTLIILAMNPLAPSASQALVVFLGIVFVAALIGFWLHNRPPASIFMGDSGSLFIGYVLAGMAIPTPLNGFMGLQAGGNVFGPLLTLLIPATVLAVPIFDTTLVTITRKWRAENASQGGRDHSSHRLVGLGLSEKKTVWLLYSFSAFGGSVAVLAQRFPDQSLPLLGMFVLVLVLAGVYLGHVKVQVAASNRMPPTWTPLVSRLLYKRRAAEVLLDTVLIVICFYGAYLLRFEGMLSESNMSALAGSLPVVVGSCLIAFFLAGIYRGQWRLIGVSDLRSYATAVIIGVSLSLAMVTLVTRFDSGHSRSAYIIFGALGFLALVGSRLSFRLFDSLLAPGSQGRDGHSTRLLIYGAGKGGKLLHEEVQSNAEMKNYTILGFIDDDPARLDGKLCGLPVKSPEYWMRQPWRNPPEIWVSSRSISDRSARQLAEAWNQPLQVRRLSLRMEEIHFERVTEACRGVSAQNLPPLYRETDDECSSPVSQMEMSAEESRH
jgi:UDP-GlcNAc:undecaprenyl-phosphate/decaprenyl-phosphate GlcNAc-1-phosphate transferase